MVSEMSETAVVIKIVRNGVIDIKSRFGYQKHKKWRRKGHNTLTRILPEKIGVDKHVKTQRVFNAK